MERAEAENAEVSGDEDEDEDEEGIKFDGEKDPAADNDDNESGDEEAVEK